MEVVSGRQEVEQTAPSLAAGVVALGDVEEVGNDAFLKLQAQAVQGGDHLLRGAILLDGLVAEHSAVRGPQFVPAAVICRHHQTMFTHTGTSTSRSMSHIHDFHLLTCFDNDHKCAVFLQKAVVELDGIGEGVHIVDHLERQRHFWENLTSRVLKK